MTARSDFDVGNKDVRRLGHLNCERRIDDVAAGQPKMQPAARGRADVLRDVGRKSDDVVVEGLFSSSRQRSTVNAAFAFICAKSGSGTMPSATSASVASNSMRNQISSLRCSVPNFPHFCPRITLNHNV